MDQLRSMSGVFKAAGSAHARLGAWRQAVAAWDPTWARLSYAFAGIAGVVFVLSLFPLAFLLNGVVPDSRLIGDVSAHVVGQRAFFQDGWHWPLLKTTLLDWPRGVSVAMTDSIPLIALPLKLFRAWLPSGFSAIQFWLALAYVLQPIAAVFALRSAGEKAFIPAMAVTLFAISMPSFLFRHPHVALSTHFLLLFALGSYFRITRARTGCFWLPSLLLLASLLVHPYIAVMTLAVLAAAPTTLVLRSDGLWRRAAAGLGVALVVTLAAASCLGYAATNPAGGYGLDSMNALSPVYPNYSHYFGRGLAFLDATGSQYEGYQFLGAGLLALTAIFLVAALLSTRTWFLRRHFGIALACLALTALAISNVVYIGTDKVFEFGPVPSFMHQLRSSGRLFWPVAYVLMVGCVASVARLVPAPAGPTLLLATALLQLLDSRDMRKTISRDLRAHGPAPIDGARLDTLLASHNHLTILPRFGCGANSVSPDFMQLLLASSRHGVAANTMYMARFAALPDCEDTATAEAPLANGELRVFLPFDAHTGPSLVSEGAAHCRMLGVVAACTLQDNAVKDLPKVAVATVHLDADVPVGTAAPAILGPGWYMPEPEGTWTVGRAATLVMTLDPPPAGAIDLQARMRGFTGVGGTYQHVAVVVNDHELATWNVLDGEPTVQHLLIPHDLLVAGPQHIRLNIIHPNRPSDLHVNGDTRQLGVFLEQLRFNEIKS